MIRKLRIKIVLVIVLVAAVMLGVIFGMSYTMTRQDLRAQSLSMMQAIAANPFEPIPPGQSRQVRLPYFVLRTDAFGNLVAIGSTDYDLTDRSFLRAVAAAASASEADIGEIPAYHLRFCRVDGSVIFADISSEQQTLRALIKNGALLGALGLLVFFCLAMLLARGAVRPVEQAWRQQTQFVADASHELKTPLASIRLLSDSIVQNENMDAETVREFVTDIGNEAERLQRTTEKLLDLSRLDDDIQVVPEPVDVKQVAVDAMVLLRPLAKEHDVRLRCELEDGCVVMATVDDMFHIIFNLVENAIKYNVPNGSVTLTLKGTDDSVQFTVADTGIGIPEEETYNIFSRFYRVDKARSREAGGSGLGLSIVHDAVKAHGGSIAVGQNKPQGSRFIVTFPRPTSEETGI